MVFGFEPRRHSKVRGRTPAYEHTPWRPANAVGPGTLGAALRFTFRLTLSRAPTEGPNEAFLPGACSAA